MPIHFSPLYLIKSLKLALVDGKSLPRLSISLTTIFAVLLIKSGNLLTLKIPKK